MPGNTMASRKAEPAHLHAVRFYKDSESLCRIVGSFLEDGFAQSQPAIVIATAAHRKGIHDCLVSDGLNVDKLKADGQLHLYDAEAVLSRCMVDGTPDAALFRRAVAPLIERACRRK